MGREIISAYSTGISGQPSATESLDKYKDKLLKLIPAEIVGAYLTLKSIIDSAAIEEGLLVLQWIVFGMLVILTPVIYVVIYKVKLPKQVVITTIAFVIWVFTVGGPFDYFFQYEGGILPIKGVIASILLVFYTLIVPVLLTEKE